MLSGDVGILNKANVPLHNVFECVIIFKLKVGLKFKDSDYCILFNNATVNDHVLMISGMNVDSHISLHTIDSITEVASGEDVMKDYFITSAEVPPMPSRSAILECDNSFNRVKEELYLRATLRAGCHISRRTTHPTCDLVRVVDRKLGPGNRILFCIISIARTTWYEGIKYLCLFSEAKVIVCAVLYTQGPHAWLLADGNQNLEVNTLLICVDPRLRVAGKPLGKKKYKVPIDYALNAPTVAILNTIGKPILPIRHDDGTPNMTLHIADLDTRVHHLYDEVSLVQSWKGAVKWHLGMMQGIPKLDDITESRDSKSGRLRLRDRVWVYELECASETMAQWLMLKWKKTYDRYGGMLVSKQKFDAQQIDFIMETYNITWNKGLRASGISKADVLGQIIDAGIEDTVKEYCGVEDIFQLTSCITPLSSIVRNEQWVELGKIWQAPAIYIPKFDITLTGPVKGKGGVKVAQMLKYSGPLGGNVNEPYAVRALQVHLPNTEHNKVKNLPSELPPYVDFLSDDQVQYIGASKGAIIVADQDEVPVNTVNVTLSWLADETKHVIPESRVMDLWDDRDLIRLVTMYGPTRGTLNNDRVRTRDVANYVIESNKTVLETYPLAARPVLTKLVHEELRAVTGRLYSVQQWREKRIFPKMLFARKLAGVYFTSKWQEVVSNYQADRLDLNVRESMEWLRHRRGAGAIYTELMNWLQHGFATDPISNVNVHLKLESLLKENPILSWEEGKSRLIVWQSKAITACFSPIFLKIKKRLSAIMKPHYIYVDGYNLIDLNEKLSNIVAADWYYESDMEKQDRQTEEQIISIEMDIYQMLGMAPSALRLWKMVHRQWRFRGATTRGQRDYMRLSGQATTALGNFITNLIVHTKTIKRYEASLRCALFLGDDIIINSTVKIAVNAVGRESKSLFNMVCVGNSYRNHGRFISMILCKRQGGGLRLIPDYIRLRHRFAVTNGVAKVTDENMKSRSVAYALMLGAMPELKTHVLSIYKGLVEMPAWYDMVGAIEVVASVYNMPVAEVQSNLRVLVDMIINPQPIKRTFKLFNRNIK
jgi:hypothetical protein